MRTALAPFLVTLVLLAVPASARADLSFEYEGQITGNGKAMGELKAPLGVAVDPAGHVLVTEYAAHRVQLFDSFEKGNAPFNIFAGPGGSSNIVGEPGQGPGQFNGPFGIATNPDDGSVYVADIGNDRVQKFAPLTKGVNYMGGFLLPEIPGTGDPRTPTGIAAYADDHLYVTSSDGPLGNLAFKVAAVVSQPPHSLGPEYWTWFGWFGMPVDAAVDPQGRVYVTDLVQHYVSVYAPSAQGNKLLRVIGGWGTDPGKLNYPAGVETDSLGRVYVTEYGGATGPSRIQVFSSYEQGNKSLATLSSVPGKVTKAGGPLLFKHLVGVAIDGTRLYVTDIGCVSDDLEPCAPDAKSSDSVWRLRFDDANADGVFDSPEPAPETVPDGNESASEQPELSMQLTDKNPPTSRILRPRSAKRSGLLRRKAFRSVTGTAFDAETFVAGVGVAIGRPIGGRSARKSARAKSRGCLWVTRRGIARGKCSKPRFLQARIDAQGFASSVGWRYSLTSRQRRALRRGKWQVASRATDAMGNVERSLVRNRNVRAYRLR